MEEIKKKGGNPFIQFIKYSRKHGLKQTFKQMNEIMIDQYRPEEALKTQILGYTGMIISLVVGVIMFFLKGLWYVSAASFFSILIIQSQLRMCIKQRRLIIKINKEMKEAEQEENKDESKEIE